MKQSEIMEKEVKDRIKEALELQNMKPIELSQRTGIPKSAISQYMSGYAKPKSDRLKLLAKALNVSEAWLSGYDTEDDFDNLSEKVKEYAVKLNALPEEKQVSVMKLIDLLGECTYGN